MNIYSEIEKLKKRLGELENQAHEPREFIRCEECKQQVKEKQNASTDSVDDKDASYRSNAKESTSSSRGLSRKKLKK